MSDFEYINKNSILLKILFRRIIMKQALVNAKAKYLLARMGHRDLLGITDVGYNNPKEVEIVDLAVLPDVPTQMQVIDGVLAEIPVEKLILATEIKEWSPDILEEYNKRFKNIKIEFIPHSDFDILMHGTKGIIRTGQYGKHAPNCIIKIGCEY
jgi:D-ribose pyranase